MALGFSNEKIQAIDVGSPFTSTKAHTQLIAVKTLQRSSWCTVYSEHVLGVRERYLCGVDKVYIVIIKRMYVLHWQNRVRSYRNTDNSTKQNNVKGSCSHFTHSYYIAAVSSSWVPLHLFRPVTQWPVSKSTVVLYFEIIHIASLTTNTDLWSILCNGGDNTTTTAWGIYCNQPALWLQWALSSKQSPPWYICLGSGSRQMLSPTPLVDWRWRLFWFFSVSSSQRTNCKAPNWRPVLAGTACYRRLNSLKLGHIVSAVSANESCVCFKFAITGTKVDPKWPINNEK